MRPKPHVYAVHVEGVGTHGKRSHIVVVFELDQANGAVTAALAEKPVLGGVEGQRYGLDDGVIEPVGREHVESIACLERRVVWKRVEVTGGRWKVAAATASPSS